jgi:hypothetical protein
MPRRASSLACGRRCKQQVTFPRFWVHALLVSTCRLLLRRTHGGDMPSSYVMAAVSKPPANPRSFLSRPPASRNNPLLDRATTQSRTCGQVLICRRILPNLTRSKHVNVGYALNVYKLSYHAEVFPEHLSKAVEAPSQNFHLGYLSISFPKRQPPFNIQMHLCTH